MCLLSERRLLPPTLPKPCPNPAQHAQIPESVPCLPASCSNQIFTGTSFVHQAEIIFPPSTQDSGHLWLKYNAELCGRRVLPQPIPGSPGRLSPPLQKKGTWLSAPPILFFPCLDSLLEWREILPKTRKLLQGLGQFSLPSPAGCNDFPPREQDPTPGLEDQQRQASDARLELNRPAHGTSPHKRYSMKAAS